MSASSILTLYLVLFAFEFSWEQLLLVLNLRNVRRNADRVPEPFRGLISGERYDRSVRYVTDRGRFSLLSAAFSALFLLLIILSGFLGTLDRLVAGLELHPYLHGIVYLFLVALLFRIVSLPLSLYSQFVIEARYGFNKMSPGLFFRDLAKGLLVSALLMAPLLAGLFWFMDRSGGFWWLWAFLFVAVFQLLVTILYPLVIAPLFNRFSPLPEGSLRQRIDELSRKLGFRTRGIFVMDGSRRSGHSNAYFTGLGGARRIVLFDTLVSSLEEEQLLGVLAHEIGHEKKRHMLKGLALSLLTILAGLWVMSLLLPYGPLYRAFGFDRPSYHAILVIVTLASGPFTFFLSPLFSLLSRRHEYEADRFAVDAMESAEPLKGALIGLSRDNLSNLTPHPLYSFYHYSHPTLAERIRAMEAHAGKAHG